MWLQTFTSTWPLLVCNPSEYATICFLVLFLLGLGVNYKPIRPMGNTNER